MNDAPSAYREQPMAMNVPDDLRSLEITGEFGSPIVGAGGMTYTAFMAIGEGGMARALLAQARGASGFEKLVVLKTIRKNALNNPEVRRLFAAEARLCAQLNHPNLVQVYDVDLDAESPCLVMEYLEGKSMHEIMLREALARPMLLTICLEVLAGLNYAHELRGFDGKLMNVIHRDVSPHNVLVTYEGAAKVLDFGIAKMAGAVSDTVTEEVKGKLSYMAPEQLLGSGVDRRTDVFAVGVMLWEIAVGHRMWDGVSEPTLMHRLATGDIPSVPDDSGVEPRLAEIIGKATAADPDERYQSALELRVDLDKFLSSMGRRPTMREVGETLAASYTEDRERMASRIRLALSHREATMPPPPNDVSDALPSRSGLLVLLVAALFAGGAAFWVFFQRAPDSGEGTETTTEVFVEEDPGDTTDSGDGRPGPPTESEAAPSARRPATGAPSSVSNREPSSEDTSDEDGQEGSDESEAVRRSLSVIPRPRPTAPRPSPVPQTAPISTAKEAPASASQPSCDPPFYFKDGIKTYRPECL